MECNILGNGPSRKSFVENGYTKISCGIPWTEVDVLFIYPGRHGIYCMNNPERTYDPAPVILCTFSWYRCTVWDKENEIPKLPAFEKRVKEYFTIKNDPESETIDIPYDTTEIVGYERVTPVDQRVITSSGHYASEWAIMNGYTKLNLYGMDAMLGDTDCLKSWSHEPGTHHQMTNWNHYKAGTVGLHTRPLKWRRAWKHLMNKYKDVEFNFVP